DVFFDDFKIEHVKSPIVSTSDYYSFGLTFNSYQRENSIPQNYQFNGKEEQDELTLGLLDFDARHYDPVLGRFYALDPRSDFMDSWSPNHFPYTNPIRFTDPSGMIAEDMNDELTSTFIRPDGTIIEHIDDNDPTIYLVTDEDAWNAGGRSKKGLSKVGIENPNHEYIPGEKIMLANKDHN